MLVWILEHLVARLEDVNAILRMNKLCKKNCTHTVFVSIKIYFKETQRKKNGRVFRKFIFELYNKKHKIIC